MSLAEKSRPEDFIHFNDFFTRCLKPAARPIHREINVPISPVDGVISELGNIDLDSIFQAKNHYYSLSQLIGDTSESLAFRNGKFITIYLSPRDYHRVHMPFAGKLLKTIYIPGKLFSVNPIAAEAIPNLFAKNERLVCLFKTDLGPMAVILVGAMIVAGINTVWNDKINTKTHRTIQTKSYENQIISFDQGDEIGSFSLGSTVIVLLNKNAPINWIPHLTSGHPVKMGEPVGSPSNN